jgi:hypothetical protein
MGLENAHKLSKSCKVCAGVSLNSDCWKIFFLEILFLKCKVKITLNYAESPALALLLVFFVFSLS